MRALRTHWPVVREDDIQASIVGHEQGPIGYFDGYVLKEFGSSLNWNALARALGGERRSILSRRRFQQFHGLKEVVLTFRENLLYQAISSG
jgi:hypothetical protein